MAQSLFRSLLITGVLALSAAAGVPPEEIAYRHAVELCDGGEWNAALPFITSSLQRFSGSDTDAVWNLRLLLAKALNGNDRPQDAARVLSAPLPSRFARKELAVRWLMNEAVAEYRQKNYSEADAIFDHAETLARESQPHVLGEVLLFRANQKFAEKKTDSAVRYVSAAAVEARRRGDHRVQLKASGTLGVILTRQRRYAAAIKIDKEVIALAKSINDQSTVQKVEGNLGWAYCGIGEYELGDECFKRALALARKLGAKRDAIVWTNALAESAARSGNYVLALSMYHEGVVLARRSKHADLAEFLTNFGTAQLENGDNAGARASAAEAITAAGADGEQKFRAQLLDARVDAATGSIESAIAKCRRIIATNASKALLWEAHGRLARLYVTDRQLDAAEREFRLAIDTAAEVRQSIEDEEVRLPFGAVVRNVYEAYVDFLVRNRGPKESLLAAERTRAQALEDLQGREAHPEVNPQQIARDRDAVILVYWLGRSGSFVWVVTSSSVDVVALPPAWVIDRRIDAYSRQIASLATSEPALKKGGAELFTMLVSPATSKIGAHSRVIIIPDGRLHAFNTETLVVPRTRRFWIEDVTITTAASLGLLNRRSSPSPSKEILVIGDPPSPDPEFPRLAEGADEIRRVASHFRARTILDGSRATPAAYQRSKADRFGYIHFVAHGVATRQAPLDSAVILARDGEEFKLYARDILQKPLHARLVTISSCHGAGTRAYTGEGLVGLAWAFLHAGAHQVIAALWEVDEGATPGLMDDLYAGVQANQDPAAALRAAKLRLVHRRNIHSRPFYWAPFVLYSGS
jgi:CHAT domain-containing protein